MKIIVAGLILAVVSSFITNILQVPSSVNIGQVSCNAEQLNDHDFDETAGQLLYIQMPDTIASTSEAYDTIHVDQLITNAALSPNGSWLALVKVGLENEPTAEVHALYGDDFYSVELEPDAGNPLYWLSDEQFLSVLTPSRTSPPAFYPDEIINPFTGERRTVLPYALTFPDTDATEPLFPGIDFGQYFLISPNGKYGMVFETDGTIILYDLETRNVFRTLEDLSDAGGWAWAADSEKLAFYGRNLALENVEEGIYVYDIGQNTMMFISDLSVIAQDESIMLEKESWSPDGEYIAFGRTTSVFGRYAIEIFDVSTGEIIDTCLTNFYTDVVSTGLDFTWSADSRYLASYGLLSDEDNASTGTVYIYDIDTGRTFAVFTGDAKLIGWTHSDVGETG